MRYKRLISFIVCFNLVSFIAFSQKIKDKEIKALISNDFENAIYLSSQLDNPLQNHFKTLISILYNKGTNRYQDSLDTEDFRKISSENLNTIQNLTLSYYRLYYNRRSENTFTQINRTYEQAKNNSEIGLLKLSLIAFLDLYARESTLNNDSFKFYLEAYKDLNPDVVDQSWILFYEMLYTGRSVNAPMDVFKNLGKESIEFLSTNEGQFTLAQKAGFYENLGVYYRVMGSDSISKNYLNLILALPDFPYLNIHKFNACLDLGEILNSNKKYKEAEYTFSKALIYLNNSDKKRSLSSYYKFKSFYYYKPQKKFDSAYYFLNEAIKLDRVIDYGANALKISELNVELRTAEKEKQIFEEQAQKERNRNIAYALAGSLLLLTIIGTQIYRNTKRKQRIAEQEKELQVQKTTAVLKEQEINTINAMVEGQEKERLRIARDLHDNLGGTLAAVKMHIGNLQNNLHKSKNPQELLDKAEELISQAYTNVRSIAHERNSGVMAREGLLPAVQKLAKKVSSSSGLSIDVQDFGLEERLSNHLEITIFRIVQELVTNVIKHAEAKEVQISLTQHEEELNIVVEDNGKGFKVGKLEEKDGMGLGSIERRVEHLEGTMLVDSTPGKGTNIIIDVPI